MNNPERRIDIISPARRAIVNTITDFWLDAFAAQDFEELPTGQNGITGGGIYDDRIYYFGLVNDDDLRKYIVTVYYHEGNMSVTPDVITVKKRHFQDDNCEYQEVYIDNNCEASFYRGGILSYDQINNSGKRLETMIDEKHDCKWLPTYTVPIERICQELETVTVERFANF